VLIGTYTFIVVYFPRGVNIWLRKLQILFEGSRYKIFKLLTSLAGI